MPRLSESGLAKWNERFPVPTPTFLNPRLTKVSQRLYDFVVGLNEGSLTCGCAASAFAWVGTPIPDQPRTYSLWMFYTQGEDGPAKDYIEHLCNLHNLGKLGVE
jgi:hypothetical protein